MIAVQDYYTIALEDHMCALVIKWQVDTVIIVLFTDVWYALQVGCGLTQYNYLFLITHNLSSDQSPVTVINRTNVTLYEVQLGETYTVEITPFLLHKIGEPSNICVNHAASFSAATATATIPTTACTVTRRPITNTPTPSTVTSEYKYK